MELTYSDIAVCLHTSRTVRRFLSGYEEQSWADVVKLTLVRGIAALQSQYQVETPSLQQLQQAVQSIDAAKGRSSLCHDHDEAERRLRLHPLEALDTTEQLADQQPHRIPRSPASAAASHRCQGVQKQQQQDYQGLQYVEPDNSASAQAQQRPRMHGLVCPRVLQSKPSGAWRVGEASGYASCLRPHPVSRAEDNQGATNPIYPDWWLTATPALQQSEKQRQSRSKGQALLNSSIPNQPQQQPDASYIGLLHGVLGACESHDGHQRAASTAARQGPSITVRCSTQAGKCAAPPRALRLVESKVKQAIAASKQLAACSMQRREQLLAVAAYGTCSDGSGEGAGDVEVGHVLDGVSCPPTDAAHHFLSSPWSSWFVPGAPPGLAASSLPSWHGDPGDVGQRSLNQQKAIAIQDGNESSYSRSTTTNTIAEAFLPKTAGVAQIARVLHSLDASLLQNTTLNAVLQQLPSHDTTTSFMPLRESFLGSTAPAAPTMELHHAHGLYQQLEGRPWDERRLNYVDMPVKRDAWAFDYGHLGAAELSAAQTAAGTGCRSQAVVKQRQLWSEKWAGDFGQLQLPRLTAQQQQEQVVQHAGSSDGLTGPHYSSHPVD